MLLKPSPTEIVIKPISFLGSSFAFLGSMGAAFAGAVSTAAGFAGLLLGAVFAGLVYVVIAIVVKLVGVKWINKLMPPVVIGPTVALIGLSLAVNAVNDLTVGKVLDASGASVCSPYVALICGIITLLLLPFYFINHRIPTRQKAARFSMNTRFMRSKPHRRKASVSGR